VCFLGFCRREVRGVVRLSIACWQRRSKRAIPSRRSRLASGLASLRKKRHTKNGVQVRATVRTPDRPNHVCRADRFSPVLTLRPTLSFRVCFLFPFSTTDYSRRLWWLVSTNLVVKIVTSQPAARNSIFCVKHETEHNLDHKTPGTRNLAATHPRSIFVRALRKEAPQDPFFCWAFAWHYAGHIFPLTCVFRVRETYCAVSRIDVCDSPLSVAFVGYL
jgi:hypothetical protein